MLINGWSIALLICFAASLFLIGMAGHTGYLVIRHWDGASDSERQIDLESRTWLAAALVENGLAVQVLSLIMLVVAAGEFSDMIAGAMCATGSFLANEYGPMSLYLKIAGIFIYGFWIVLHRLDLRSEYYPLIRIKFIYLFFLIPYLLFDGYYLVNYLTRLTPDIITSCCGVIFSEKGVKTNFLFNPFFSSHLPSLFYSTAAVLLLGGIFLLKRGNGKGGNSLVISYGALALFFFPLALVTVTLFFSSFIYAMPNHNCPFDILHREYNYIGVPLYLSLFGSSFLAVSGSFSTFFASFPGLTLPVSRYRDYSLQLSVGLLVLFVFLASLPVVLYLYGGGES